MTIDKYYDISKSKRIDLSFMTNKEASEKYGKGWGYSFVYSLVEIRDIFLTLRKYGITTISEFTNNYVKNKIPHTKPKSKWTKRRVLEVLNSLVNFGLIDNQYHILKENYFSDSIIGEPLSPSDKAIFREIYFTYFRFRELLLLYVNPDILVTANAYEIHKATEQYLVNNSNVLFSFTESGRFIDSFFTDLKDNPVIYTIPKFNDEDKNSGAMRFWDVFMKWGDDLGVLEKFNMVSMRIKLLKDKSFVCSYILSEKRITTPLLSYIDKKFPNKRSIDLSLLSFNLCIDFRVSCNDAKDYIIEEYKKNIEQMSLVRTSEVFIKEKDFLAKEKVFYPQYKDSYISNIILRK
jgi:hypothetical protein